MSALDYCVAAYLDLAIGYDATTVGSPRSTIRGTCVVKENAFRNNDGIFVEYVHNSSVFDGVPFNSIHSPTTNMLSVGYRLKLK